jgi:glycosyltransferase involved in cell wall biosynthesis
MIEPLVSVVTPVHNGANYLEECISSVLNQSYKRFEYIIVDNASSDSTSQLAQKAASSDNRICYIRYENLVNANDNHNRAFKSISSKSEFCKVVQADDWIYPQCIERMVRLAQDVKTIGIVGSYRLWGDKVDLVGFPYTESVLNGRRVLRQCLLGGPYVTGAPTALLYRSHLIREVDPFYAADFEHADTEAAYRVLNTHDFGYLHQVLTFARRQSGARMSWASRMSTYTPENIRFLLRYGPSTLTEPEYRRQLRIELRKYVWFQAKQVPKPSRFSDVEYFSVHRAEIEGILDEGDDDVEVRAAMRMVKMMLARRPSRRRNSATLPIR